MRKIFIALCTALFAFSTLTRAQGWPANYDGVMLQGFYWDSYSDTQWSKLTSQADELSAYFNLIWVPQSGYCNTTHMQMGYLPIWWFNHLSAFGTEAQLRTMIKTFKDKGTGIIEDVVINHRAGNTNWCDFPTETWKGNTMSWTLADICANDDGGNTRNQDYNVTGAADTGDDFGGGRDLDHTSANVQKNIKLYLDFLLNDLGYSGFRYDMVKGYAPRYTGEYNASSHPTYSVGEYWDGNPVPVKNWIEGTRHGNVIQSAAFDFPLKFYINEAFGNGTWNKLTWGALANDPNYSRYAVTFVDNHDTARPSNEGGSRLNANIAAANAYILAMPGTPCVFLSHWKSYKTLIKKLILSRKATGVSNQSTIISASEQGSGFVLNVQGTKGKVLLLLGNTGNVSTLGYQLAVEGDNFKYFVSENIDLSALKNIKDDASTFVAPAFCKVGKDETCAFFEAPGGWNSTVYCWRWDNTGNYTGGIWPGVACTRVGTATNGNGVWKWTWNKAFTSAAASNTGIIFSNNGTPQTIDMPFTNGGYYDITGLQGVVNAITTSIGGVEAGDGTVITNVYTLDGRLLRRQVKSTNATEGLPKGVYIVGNKKIVVK